MEKMKIFYPALVLFFVSFMLSCSSDDGDGGNNNNNNNSNNNNLPEVEMPTMSETTIWSGSTITFVKNIGANPDLEENQDRITNNVWITRKNSGGQIYNAVTESEPNIDISPDGTLWAIGTTANFENLTFDRFRATLEKPKDNVGVDLVMLLVEDNIAIDVKFVSWSQQQVGGFAYERSTEE